MNRAHSDRVGNDRHTGLHAPTPTRGYATVHPDAKQRRTHILTVKTPLPR